MFLSLFVLFVLFAVVVVDDGGDVAVAVVVAAGVVVVGVAVCVILCFAVDVVVDLWFHLPGQPPEVHLVMGWAPIPVEILESPP